MNEQPATLGKALWEVATLPLRIAAVPAMASLPPEARRHFQQAAREARAAAGAVVLRPARKEHTPPLPDITLD